MNRPDFLRSAASSTALSVSRKASAQVYPTCPLRISVGFPAGVPNVLDRLIAQWLSKRLGQNFLVENRPGAGGKPRIADARQLTAGRKCNPFDRPGHSNQRRALAVLTRCGLFHCPKAQLLSAPPFHHTRAGLSFWGARGCHQRRQLGFTCQPPSRDRTNPYEAATAALPKISGW